MSYFLRLMIDLLIILILKSTRRDICCNLCKKNTYIETNKFWEKGGITEVSVLGFYCLRFCFSYMLSTLEGVSV